MKKSLVALAVLGTFAGAASAQSSVTIYGLFNVAVMKSNSGTANITQLVPGAAGNIWEMRQFGTSRLGFRGNEDLGGGMSAQFTMEHRFNPDDGAQNNASSFWSGRSFVQLTQAGVGSIYLGRDYTPIFWVQLKTDPFGNDGLAQSGSAATYAGYTTPASPAALGGARAPNSIGFVSASFGGFVGRATVALSEGTQTGRIMGLAGEYTAGPLYAGVGYETVKDGVADGLGLVNVGVSYDFGVAKVMGYYGRSQTRTAGTTRGENTNHVWALGGTAKVGPGLAKAMYYKIDPRFANNTRQKLGLGYDYLLSKRTNLYVEAAFGKEDARTNKNAYGFGVKHTF
ncbi:porin [Piscinibacter sakaiensis]|uniref:Outer membrane porin protein BP0840 n=1 Tax=Piscinibacter sakaiensis TaxID=1547922 RepID=A0A0K8NWN9_PISS1|nr:porin [Piscinibacter sakaiensis]GAP34788.1 outer membrane porin protein BP0840 precursor [Piscinibacter sakaiensis]